MSPDPTPAQANGYRQRKGPSPMQMAEFIEQLRAERKMLRVRERLLTREVARLQIENDRLRGQASA